MNTTNDKILIRGLEISACHGVHGFEKTTPQRFVIDADISLSFGRARLGDALQLTVSYSDACKIFERVMTENKFNLIEKLAYECAYALMESYAIVSAISLTVWKPDAPVKAKVGNVGVSIAVERERVFLSLGSSMGDRKGYLDTAIKKLGATRGIAIERVSDYMPSKPYGGVAQNEFLNCALQLNTFLTPHELLRVISRIENECGRMRDKRWDDRTLDIDIIFFGNKVIRDEYLIIPHPDYKNRDFVIEPLKEIAPYLFK